MPQTKTEIASAKKTVTGQDRQFARVAFTLFQQHKYTECHAQLKKLSELRPHDARVACNKAVVEYHMSKLCATDTFVRQFNATKKQLELGVVTSSDNELDDIDRGYLLYNQAVLNFHMKKYYSGISILERLIKIIEPLDDVLATKVCILLIEMYLTTNQLDQAFGIITYVENQLLPSKVPENKDQKSLLVEQFKPKIHMFKVRLYLMRQFYNQCKRELKLAMNSSQNSAEALFLKSNLECVRGNYQKAMKQLNSAPKPPTFAQTGHPLAVMYYNDLCLIHFAMRKYNLAVLYASKSLKENIHVMKQLPPIEKSKPLSGRALKTLAINRRASITYNLGVTLLHARKPAQAFNCLLEARTEYQRNPRYWLRLAESCIGTVCQASKEKEEIFHQKNDVVRGVLGAGPHRKLLINTPKDNNNRLESHSSAMPAPTLEFSSTCLTNAMLLLPKETDLENNMTIFLANQKPPDDPTDGNGAAKKSHMGRMFVQCPPGESIQTKEIYSLRCSILCCQAYVAIRLADYYKSEEYCRTLFRMKHASSMHKFLAQSYLLETLIKMNLIQEAIEELSNDTLSNSLNNYVQDISGRQLDEELPSNVAEAHAVMMINVASAYTLRGENEKSKHVLKQVSSLKLPSWLISRAVLLSVFCELKTGNIGKALTLLKRREVFPSGRLIDRIGQSRIYHSVQQMVPPDAPMRAPIGTPAPSNAFTPYVPSNNYDAFENNQSTVQPPLT